MSRRSLRVLVVDDERTITDSLALILQNHGHKTLGVYTPEAAIDLAWEFQPDVLVADVIMPDINGIELARYFGDHFSGCRVLLISGSESTTNLLNDARRNGHEFAFMQKPIPPNLILDFVDHCPGKESSEVR